MSVSPIYRAALELAVPCVPHVLRAGVQRAAHAGRLGAAARLAAWGRAARDTTRPLAWFHATSVGEGLQARAVLTALRALHPELQVVYTHFSPSAERFAAGVGADVHAYLPYDRGRDVDLVIDALRPNLLVFSKLDLWPLLATRAAARGTRVALVAGTVRPSSGRLRWPVRALTAPGYAALDLALAVTDADAHRLARLGTRPERTRVTGDPRIDSAIAVVDAVDPQDPLRTLLPEASTLVAGSTWPEDEAVLLAAFAVVRRDHPAARLVVVPHEPTPPHLAALEAQATRLGLPRGVRLSEGVPAAAAAPWVVVDQLGALARLYATGALAYVGGGFGGKGIHSVIEPAAWGRPVIVGPLDRGAREVALLRDAGGAVQLHAEAAVPELTTLWEGWLLQPEQARTMGAAALAALAPDRGAARRSAEGLNALLVRQGGSPT